MIPPATAARRKYFTARTMLVLEILATERLTAPEIAERLNVCSHTARGVLYRLAHEGYVTKGPGWRDPWVPTDQLRELGERLTESECASTRDDNG